MVFLFQKQWRYIKYTFNLSTDRVKIIHIAKWPKTLVCSVLSPCRPNLAWTWTYPRGLRTHHEIRTRAQTGLAGGWKPENSSFIKMALLRLYGGCGLISLHGQYPRGIWPQRKMRPQPPYSLNRAIFMKLEFSGFQPPARPVWGWGRISWWVRRPLG